MPSSFPKRFHKTLGFRLSVWYAGIFILSSVIFSLVSYLSVFSSLRDQRTSIQSHLAEYKALVDTQGLDAIEALTARQRKPSRRTTYFIRIIDTGNQTIFLSHPRLWEQFEIAEAPPSQSVGQWRYYTSRRDGDLIEVASTRLASGALLQVGKGITDRNELVERFGATLLATIIPMVLVGLAGGAFLAHRALRPIRSLTAVARSIVDTGRFDARVPDSKTGDELSELVALFNQMLGKIQLLIAGMREALDNVAHDLRTPVARLRGVAEEALRAQGGSEKAPEALADCIEEADRITATLNALMDISEAESGAMKLMREELDLPALVGEVVELYRYIAEEKQVSLSVHAPNELRVRADRARLRQVITNLLDNAIKYTPSGGRVDINASRNQQQIAVEVTDTGAGIPADELPRIWERLYRGDKSRSQRGLGLGLSLVKAVVHAHGGHVEASANSPAGSRFSFYLPLDAGALEAPSSHLSKM